MGEPTHGVDKQERSRVWRVEGESREEAPHKWKSQSRIKLTVDFGNFHISMIG